MTNTWLVLLLGGASGVGKTTVAPKVAAQSGAAWLMVDDLRLAMARSGLVVPNPDAVSTFNGMGGLVDLAAFMGPAIEAIVEHHADERLPVVIEGDAIVPSLLDRPRIRARARDHRIKMVILNEPDEAALEAAHHLRGRSLSTSAHAKKNFLFGEWLKGEADRARLPVVMAHPKETLADRILRAVEQP